MEDASDGVVDRKRGRSPCAVLTPGCCNPAAEKRPAESRERTIVCKGWLGVGHGQDTEGQKKHQHGN